MDIYDLLDELYFLISFQELSNKFSEQENTFQTYLKDALKQGYIAQHIFDMQTQDYAKQSQIDFEHIEKYHYLATKEGLLFLNGIG